MNFFINFSAGNKELNKGLNNLNEAEKNIVLAHSKHSNTCWHDELQYFPTYNVHFCLEFWEENKDAHYTWVVPEIPCICSCVL